MDNKIACRIGLVFALVLFSATASVAMYRKEILDEKSYTKVLTYVDISQEDLDNYRKIFQLIRAENLKKADEAAKGIKNQILMGHVLAEKYLSKTYRSSSKELGAWLKKYGDHPQAKRIYGIYVRKGGRNASLSPDNKPVAGERYSSPYSWYNVDYTKIKPGHAKFLREKVVQFKRHLNRGNTKNARNILEDKKFKLAIPNRDYDAMSGALAFVYFLDNHDELALEWSEKAGIRSNDATALWVAGLVSWRQEEYRNAADYFSRLGRLDDNDEWLVAAGAYWAYRSHDKADEPNSAKKWLKIASKYNRTFYGILASYKLGTGLDYNWSGVTYFNNFNKSNYVDEMLISPAIQRSLILLNISSNKLAEAELNNVYLSLGDKQKEVILYIAQQYKMHNLGIKITNYFRRTNNEMQYDHLAYPVPDWEFEGGWKVDKAFVFALIRQESAFHPEAMSSAGARGLMQLMPNTAIHVTKNRKLRRDRRPLLEIEYNLEVGQNYVNYLLEKPFIDGNLFFLTAAYNAGPGNLQKWQKRMNYDNDPLMFIEAIPSRETRLYIERVMANYWIYNMRFGLKDPKSLEQASDDQWPTL